MIEKLTTIFLLAATVVFFYFAYTYVIETTYWCDSGGCYDTFGRLYNSEG